MYYGPHRHLLDALESGDGAAASRDLADRPLDRAASGLALGSWRRTAPRCSTVGSTRAERLARERFELIQRAGFQNAPMFFAIQLAGVRREQGRLGELEAGMRALAERLPNMPSWRATLAYLYAEDGREAEARAALESVAA
jgi:hypothetical protein